MKKARIIQLSTIIMVIILLVVSIGNVLCYSCSSDEARLKLFYNEEENSMDLVFFGSSAVRAGYMPTKAYENYNIKSYNYGVNHMPLPATKYMIQEVLQYQSPQVIVIDINGITYCSQSFTETKANIFTDSIRAGENKTNALNDLFGSNRDWEDEVSFIKYHKNILYLSKCLSYKKCYENYGNNATILKGYTTNPTDIKDFSEAKLIDPNTLEDVVTFNDYEQKTVDELLDYCDSIKDKVKIVFARFPRVTIKNFNEWEMGYINAMQLAVEERGYVYVDFYDYIEDFDLDLAKDFNDDTHLNVFGAEKFTNFICNYLITNHDLIASEDDSKWEQCVSYANEYYEHIKESTINKEGKEFYEFELAKTLGVYGV